jgi:hypothetical protein
MQQGGETSLEVQQSWMDKTYLNMNDPFHRHVHNPLPFHRHVHNPLHDLLLD